jgi:hypothetical protein
MNTLIAYLTKAFKRTDIFTLSIYTIFIGYFFYLLFASLNIGGRWDINEQIAFGNRIVEGVWSYSNGITDLFFPSSPYFPGVGLISSLIEFLGLNNIYVLNNTMLFFAVLIGFMYIISLKSITQLINPNISTYFVISIIFIFYISKFGTYKNYMWEFKPDTILLLFTNIIFLLIEKQYKYSRWSMFVVIVLLFIASFMKQSVFITYFIVLLSVLTKQTFTTNKKILYGSSIILVGFLSLYFLYIIDNCIYFTVIAMGEHPFLNSNQILSFFKNGMLQNKLYIALMLFSFIKNYKELSRFSIYTKYFIFSNIWFGFSLISMAKLGGNLGNFEVGLIVYLPFVILFLFQITQKVNNHFIFKLALLVYTIYIGRNIPTDILNKFQEYKIKTHTVHESAEYLHTHFQNKIVFVDGNTYIVAKMANMNIITEAETLGHFNIPNYNMSHIKKALKSQKYDLLFFQTKPRYYKDKDIEKIMNQNYITYKDKQMTEYLNNKIFIRKEGE